jgi:hypothetical protein
LPTLKFYKNNSPSEKHNLKIIRLNEIEAPFKHEKALEKLIMWIE